MSKKRSEAERGKWREKIGEEKKRKRETRENREGKRGETRPEGGKAVSPEALRAIKNPERHGE